MVNSNMHDLVLSQLTTHMKRVLDLARMAMDKDKFEDFRTLFLDEFGNGISHERGWMLVDLVRKKCKVLILLGEAKEKINRAIGDFSETYLVGTFEEAVYLAYQKSRSGDIILLSPGCASQDMFKNYEERGDFFKKIVARF